MFNDILGNSKMCDNFPMHIAGLIILCTWQTVKVHLFKLEHCEHIAKKTHINYENYMFTFTL